MKKAALLLSILSCLSVSLCEAHSKKPLTKRPSKLFIDPGLIDIKRGIMDSGNRDLNLKQSSNIANEAVAEALQSEAVFVRADDSKYIAATYGCGPCVAVGGYDETNEIAFVVHFATANEVRKCGGKIFYNISRLASKPLKQPIKLHLRGGYEDSETTAAIKLWIQEHNDLPMKIESEKANSAFSYGGESLFVNAKTGEVGDYDPKLNSYARKMGRLEEMHALRSAYKPDIRIAHRPEMVDQNQSPKKKNAQTSASAINTFNEKALPKKEVNHEALLAVFSNF